MIRAVTVEFDFDTETEEVTNVKCNVEGQVKKTRKTTKKDEVVVLEDEDLMVREETRLVFNNRILDTIGVTAGDRIDIKYEKEGKFLIPVLLADDKGNKLTKSNTVAYRGKKNEVLEEFGTEFTIVPFNEGVWKLVPKGNVKPVESVEEAIKQAEEVEPILIVDADDTTDIDEIQFSL